MTKQDSLVSIVTIFLNEERFLQESVQSILAQSYPNWELFLVDDGSSDHSTELAREYARQHPGKIHFLEHPNHQNRGMSASRNLGLRHARGDYVAFLDADDVWVPRKLEQQVALATKHPEAGMIYGTTRWWYSWARHANVTQYDFVSAAPGEGTVLVQPPAFTALFVAEQIEPPSINSILVRREVAEKVLGFEDSFRSLYEDQAFLAKVGLQAPVLFANHCWDWYRQHPNSTCSIAGQNGNSALVKARLVFLDWFAGYLSGQQVVDRSIWLALWRQRWLYGHYADPSRFGQSEQRLNRHRWLKKWVLRLEAMLLPRSAQEQVWGSQFVGNSIVSDVQK